MTAQPVRNLFIHTVNYRIWLVLVCDVLAWHGDEQLAYVWWVTLRDTLTTEFHFIPHHSVSSLSSLTPVNSGNTQFNKIRAVIFTKVPPEDRVFLVFVGFNLTTPRNYSLVKDWFFSGEHLQPSVVNSQSKTSAFNSRFQKLSMSHVSTVSICRI